MIARAVFAALRQLVSQPLRAIVLRSVGLTIVLLIGIWAVLTKGFDWFLAAHPLSQDYPVIDGFVYFMAGAGLLVALAYFIPAVSAAVAGLFLDDAAEIVERSDFPQHAAGMPLSVGRSFLLGIKFAAVVLIVNLGALTLFFIPVVNAVAFFVANSYLLGREYFEMAAARFRPLEEARQLRRENRRVVWAAGAVLAGLALVPILNLTVPVFGIALMVHIHKYLAGRAPALASG